MRAELLELSKKAGGSTRLLLVTMKKYHTTWQKWAPGEIPCTFTQNNNKSKPWDSQRDGAALPF